MHVTKLTKTGRPEKGGDASRDVTRVTQGFDGTHVQATSFGVDWVNLTVGPYFIRLSEAELRHLLAGVEQTAALVEEAKSQLAS